MAKGQIRQKRDKIDQKQFESLCAIQCTEDEILSVLNISKKTLIRWCQETYGVDFSTIYAEKRQYGKASLRRLQWKKAEAGSDTMLIWLGKNMLGQTDAIQEKHEINNGIITDLIGALGNAKTIRGNAESETDSVHDERGQEN